MAHEKSIFEELAPFSKMVVDQGRGVVVSDLAFASAEDRYSTAFIQLAGSVLSANSNVKLFQKNVGETGQGSAVNLTIAETNNKQGDRQPSNQVYIGTHLGFQLYRHASSGALNVLPFGAGAESVSDMYKVAASTTWSLNVGDGIERTLGTVLEYPAGSGIDTPAAIPSGSGVGTTNPAAFAPNNGWVGCKKRKLPIPVIFPPNISVDIQLLTGAAQTLGSVNSGDYIAYRATFTGFRMTLPA